MGRGHVEWALLKDCVEIAEKVSQGIVADYYSSQTLHLDFA